MPPKRALSGSEQPQAKKQSKLSRSELCARVLEITAGDNKLYFRAIERQADVVYRIFERLRVSQGFLDVTPDDADTVEVAVKNLVAADEEGPLLAEASDAMAAFEDSDQPIPEIMEVIESGSWEEWRELFSSSNLKYVLKMIVSGVETREFVVARFFSFAALRMGLGAVNSSNKLTNGVPPPYINAKYDSKELNNQQNIFECTWRTLLGLLMTTRKSGAGKTDPWQKLSIDRSKKQIDTRKEAWDRAIARVLFQQSVTRENALVGQPGRSQDSGTDDKLASPEPLRHRKIQTQRSAAVTWLAKRMEYKARLSAILSHVRVSGMVSFLPPLNLHYRMKSGRFSSFREPPTNLDFAGSKIVVESPQAWSSYVAAFYDPVMEWIDVKVGAAVASEKTLNALLEREAGIQNRASQEAVAIAASISRTVVELETQRIEAEAFDASYLVDDRKEASRRLDLYEQHALWDTVIGNVEEIFLAEKNYALAYYSATLFDLDLALSADRGTSSQSTGPKMVKRKQTMERLKALVGEGRAEEIVAELRATPPEGARSKLLSLHGIVSRADATIDRCQDEYADLLVANAPFLACAEIASRLLRHHATEDDETGKYPELMDYLRRSTVQSPAIEASIAKTFAAFKVNFTKGRRLTPHSAPRSAATTAAVALQTRPQTEAPGPRQAAPPPSPRELLCLLSARFGLLRV